MTFTLRRKSRRHTPRHIALLSAPENEETLPEAVRRIEAEDEAAAMTQAIPYGIPDGARWAEDVPLTPAGQPSFTPRPTGPQPMLGTQPARRIRKTPAPVRPVSRVERDILERVRDGLEHMDGTRPYTPPRTEADRIRQDAATPRTPGPLRPLPPETPMAAEPVRIRHATASRARVGRLAYPSPDGFSRHAREYADLMRHVSFITGTHSRYETPAAWGAATIAIGGAA